jgi:hypothetical protein
MGRKYGDKDFQEVVLGWLEGLRAMVRERLHKEGIVVISMNDVHNLIMDGWYPPAPRPDHPEAKRGQILTNFFKTPYYRKTGNRVKSTIPIQRSRRIFEWEYVPELDDRDEIVTRSGAMKSMQDDHVWS